MSQPFYFSDMNKKNRSIKKFRLMKMVVTIWLIICSGCAYLFERRLPIEEVEAELKWDLESYAAFVQQNMFAINEQYSNDYVPYDFIVDTDFGSTSIQSLINPEATAAIRDELGLNDLDMQDKLSRIYHYITQKYMYVMQPYKWQTVKETIQSQRGDCKNLSLLMLSLLISLGYEAHGAISNGHMWVNVNYGKQWIVFELDQDPDRNRIYTLPGFYNYPLYKIYVDHSEKRKRLIDKSINSQ
ncbi:transglutaminase domain-containing protein [Thermodesulfobacteriota bacterium]